MDELDWLRTREEGQFLERKGCYDRSGGKAKRRDVREVAGDVAETLMAMANADGGTLVVGIEDDGTVTGMDYPDDRISVIREAPQTRVVPPLTARIQDRQVERRRILIFDVDWSADVHQLTDGRYKLRVGDRNMPFPAQDIAALKESRRRRATEIQTVPGATLDEIDLDLARRLAVDDGERRSPTRVLERYRLVESRERRVAVSLAALLLFGKDPGRWHPRCGIDFVRYAGTERQVGTAFNVTRRDRIDGPLVELPRLAFTTIRIRSQVRERQPLVDLSLRSSSNTRRSRGERRSSTLSRTATIGTMV